ncbi:MAG: hypothetical protein CMK56_02275 [Proteobacteria bacterium]|nr:hypothetical protein [Pseudomonadota bacterium]
MNNESLIDFPTDFPIKIIGKSQLNLQSEISKIVIRHASDFSPSTAETRSSRSGNYQSITCTIRAISKQQLDELYNDLSRSPLVLMVF